MPWRDRGECAREPRLGVDGGIRLDDTQRRRHGSGRIRAMRGNPLMADGAKVVSLVGPFGDDDQDQRESAGD
jgi:hypothetical protein